MSGDKYQKARRLGVRAALASQHQPSDREWQQFGEPSTSPCVVCGTVASTRAEARFNYVVCRQHANVPPIAIVTLPSWSEQEVAFYRQAVACADSLLQAVRYAGGGPLDAEALQMTLEDFICRVAAQNNIQFRWVEPGCQTHTVGGNHER